MNLFSPKVTIIRTIWPYEEGWGVVIKQFGKPDTVLETGLSEERAKAIAKQERKRLKSK